MLLKIFLSKEDLKNMPDNKLIEQTKKYSEKYTLRKRVRIKSITYKNLDTQTKGSKEIDEKDFLILTLFFLSFP